MTRAPDPNQTRLESIAQPAWSTVAEAGERRRRTMVEGSRHRRPTPFGPTVRGIGYWFRRVP